MKKKKNNNFQIKNLFSLISKAMTITFIRMCGDFMHLASVIIVLIQIYGTKSCAGISFQTQALYALVFCCRYLDLFWNFWSIYNWIFKVIFITTSIIIIYWMKFKDPYKKTYDAKLDSFKGWFLVIPCFILALLFHVAFTPFEILWAFSIYLEVFCYLFVIYFIRAEAFNKKKFLFEITRKSLKKQTNKTQLIVFGIVTQQSVAILPQLVMVQKIAREHQGTVRNITSHYVFCLGSYRALYLLNWIYRYATEPNYWDPIAWTAGIVQTALYSDFLYYYLKARYLGINMQLPV
ncbi:hypothetical protein RFI_26182 [Reticulomyxa filosa]|uniref:ER lumen protein-retaining receptor n=1 Tax=Reticulomyxa filosa TaxID=46433 RepID=X6MBY9_RETFI|nr:hypothetical protein RFI_26182 [Reticulomyxa filosa]|eukprot:ETO11196.1 hypothetical protein RFI_26182 [Reticulomyxa filosa]